MDRKLLETWILFLDVNFFLYLGNEAVYLPISLDFASLVLMFRRALASKRCTGAGTVLLLCTSCADIRRITMNRLITIEKRKTRQPAGGSR